MSKGRTCGRCSNFVRIKSWGNDRNGLCDKHDYNCHSDSSYAKYCKSFLSKKYIRQKRDYDKINT